MFISSVSDGGRELGIEEPEVLFMPNVTYDGELEIEQTESH